MNLAIRTKQNKDKTDKQTNHTEGGYFEETKTNNNNKKLSKKSVRAPRSPIPQTYRVDLVYFIPLKQQAECTFKAQTQRTSGKIRAIMYIRAKVTNDTIDRLERKA